MARSGPPEPERPETRMQPARTDPSRRPTARTEEAGPDQKRTDRKGTSPVTETPGTKRRSQLVSLEPPKRGRGPGTQDGRLDNSGIIAQRQRALMGSIGRNKTRPVSRPPGGKTTTKPQLRRGEGGKSVELGGSNREVMESMLMRRKTRLIPKDGGLAGDVAPLEGMRPISSPSAPPLRPTRDPRVPPLVNMRVPQPTTPPHRDEPPPPPAARGHTLEGVSAEELLGEEGRELLEQMRRREAEARRNAPAPAPKAGAPLGPRMHDSSLVAFQAAEYVAGDPMQDAAQGQLEPQGGFLAPGAYAPPPSDDLGFELPVDYGKGAQSHEPDAAAHEYAAREEMEHRTGYLLWLQGVITYEEVQDSLLSQQDVSAGARELLQHVVLTDQQTLYRFLAQHETLAPVDLERVRPTARALAVLKPAIARSYRVLPLEQVGELLLVAVAWPFDPKRLLELRRLTSSKVKLFIVSDEEIDAAVAHYYPPASTTLRSPRPAQLANPAEAESAVTGEGEALAGRYDPTLSGGDSGLYQPVAEFSSARSGDFGVTDPDGPEFDSHAETARQPAIEEDEDASASEAGPRSKPAAEELDPFGD